MGSTMERSEARLAQLLGREVETYTLFQDNPILADEPMRPLRQGEQDGVALRIRLASYRALPLSCIENIELEIDGTKYSADALTLFIDNVPYCPAEMGDLFNRWWFILDHATVFAPTGKLGHGPHHVEIKLATVEPYITAGRFTFHHADARELAVTER